MVYLCCAESSYPLERGKRKSIYKQALFMQCVRCVSYFPHQSATFPEGRRTA